MHLKFIVVHWLLLIYSASYSQYGNLPDGHVMEGEILGVKGELAFNIIVDISDELSDLALYHVKGDTGKCWGVFLVAEMDSFKLDNLSIRHMSMAGIWIPLKKGLGYTQWQEADHNLAYKIWYSDKEVVKYLQTKGFVNIDFFQAKHNWGKEKKSVELLFDGDQIEVEFQKPVGQLGKTEFNVPGYSILWESNERHRSHTIYTFYKHFNQPFQECHFKISSYNSALSKLFKYRIDSAKEPIAGSFQTGWTNRFRVYK